jgi:glycosyltransferase involved in cell wall biosynthesis
MKNICVFIRELVAGGAEKQSLLLCKALRNDYNPYLVVLHNKSIDQKYLDFIKNEGISVVYLEGNLVKKTITLIIFLKKQKIGIIFSFLFINNILGWIAGRLAGVPYFIGGVRNCKIVPSKLWITRFMHNYFFKLTVFNNHSGAENLVQKGFRPDKCIIIPNCCEIERLPDTNRTGQKIRIITLARFMPQKDYITALQSVRLLREKLSDEYDFEYLIMGYGPEEQKIRGFINAENMSGYVRIIIKPDHPHKHLESADIYLSTSLKEGLSNSIMEAMAYSLPVVATNVGDNNRLVENEKNGYLLPAKDFRSIADKLSWIITHPELIRFYGENSHSKITRNYSLNTFFASYKQLIENLH